MNILILDNYDSFTYNLVQYVEEITGEEVAVFRNNEITLEEVENYNFIILSPGPGLPADAGIMPELIQRYGASKRILGVCLGHQAIAEAYGGSLYNLSLVYHGIATPIHQTEHRDSLFEQIPPTFQAGRYHSWAVRPENLPDCLTVTAIDDQGAIMAIAHNSHDVRGVQFHPESIMTEFGKQIIRNFFN